MAGYSLNALERTAVGTLGGVYALRMLGLFIILPVFAIYAETLTASTPMLAGVAVGIYGLTSALLQIPMGWLSDRFGRRVVVFLGLAVFVLGSLVAADATDIWQMILGRALQGAGAVSAALTAWVADLSREEVRAKVMALIGIMIGLTFIASLIMGPLLAGMVGVEGIFVLVAVLGVLGMVLAGTLVPTSIDSAYRTTGTRGSARMVLKDTRLLLLSFGAAAIHMVLVANFMSLPLAMRDLAGMPVEEHSLFYLVVLAGSALFLFPILRMTQSRVATGMQWAALGLAGCEAVLLLVHHDRFMLGGVLLLFFIAFNLLEAQLPTQVSRLCPADLKGTALGILTTAQFLGAFLGGVLTGLFMHWDSLAGLYALLTGAMVFWAWLVNWLKSDLKVESTASSMS